MRDSSDESDAPFVLDGVLLKGIPSEIETNEFETSEFLERSREVFSSISLN